MLSFIRSLLPTKTKYFFHPSFVGSTNRKGWKVGPIESSITKIEGKEYNFEYQTIRRYGRIIDTIFWCPLCGYRLSSGPEGGGSINAVCSYCDINYGSPDLFFGTQNLLTISSSLLARRGQKIFVSKSNCVNVIFSEWSKKYKHLNPSCSKYPSISFWNKHGFWLCSVHFEDDGFIELSYSMIDFTEIHPMDDLPMPITKAIVGESGNIIKTVDPVGITKFKHDLSDPNSIKRIEHDISKVAEHYYEDGYGPMLDLMDRIERKQICH